MTNYELFREIVRAAALGKMEEAEALNERVSDAERASFSIFQTAAFSGVLEKRFATDSSREAVQRFVDEMRYDYRDAQPPIRPLVLEGVIRGILGEEHLLDEISIEDQLLYQIPTIRKIVDQSDELKSRLDDFLNDTEALAREWVEDQ